VPYAEIGTTGGDSLVVAGQFAVPLSELADASEATLPALFAGPAPAPTA